MATDDTVAPAPSLATDDTVAPTAAAATDPTEPPEAALATDDTVAPELVGSVDDTVAAATASHRSAPQEISTDVTIAAPITTPEKARERAVDDLIELESVDPSYYARGREIARGGMGRIVSARDRRHGRPVALKELLSAHPAATTRFQREAFITARLQHPAIVPLYEAGRWYDGEPFYSMKLVHGQPLDKVIAKKKSFQERLGLLPNVIAVCDALAYAHSQRVIHRDLKPANVLVGDYGETVVIDWGLAKDLSEDGAERDDAAPAGVSPPPVEAHAISTDCATLAVADDEIPAGPPTPSGNEALTVAGQAMGTPAYMPPEQAEGCPVDERADVYSLGAMLYHLLSGALPYSDAASAPEAIARVIQGPPTSLQELVGTIPPDLLAVVDKAMARDPAERYPTAGELAEDLKRFETGQLVGAHAYSAWQLLRRWLRRHAAAVTATAVVLAVLAVGGTLSVRRILAERDRAARNERLTKETTYQLLEEEGYRELRAGRLERALVYFAEAYRRGNARPSLRFLLADTLRSVPLRLGSDEDVVGEHGAAFCAGGDRVLSWGRQTVLQDAATGEVLVRLGTGTTMAAVSADCAWAITDSEEEAVYAVIYDLGTGRRRAVIPAGDAKPVRVAMTPDGRRAMVVDEAGAVIIWDVGTSTQQAQIAPPEPEAETEFDGTDAAQAQREADQWHPLPFAALSPDGERLVTRSGGWRAAVWDASTGQRLAGLGDQAPQVLPSPAGDAVLTIDPAGAARVWRSADGKLRFAVASDRGAVRSATFSPNGAQLALGGVDHEVWIIDAESDTVIQRIQGHHWPVIHLRFSGDGKRLLTMDELGVTKIWDAATGALVATLEGALMDLYAPLLSEDGSHLVTLGTAMDVDQPFEHEAVEHRFVHLWDGETGVLLASIGQEGFEVAEARFDPTGTRLLVVGNDGAKLWPLRFARVSRTLAADQSIANPSVSPDGTRVVLASDDASAELRSLVDDTAPVLLTGHSDQVQSAVFSRDGQRVATASLDQTVRVWDAPTGAPLATLAHDREVEVARFSDDGTAVLTLDQAGVIRLWDATRADPIATVAPERARAISAIELGPDGDTLVVGYADGLVEVWRLRARQRVAAVTTSDRPVRAIAFSPSRNLVAVVGDDPTIRLWRTDSWEAEAALTGHTDSVTWVEFDPSGRFVLTASADKTAKLWDVQSETQAASLEGHAAGVVTARFSADGSRIATAGRDNTVKIWDVDNGRALASYAGRLKGRSLESARFSPDGERLVTTSGDRSVQMWQLPLETRAPAEVNRDVDRLARWRLDDGRLVPRSSRPDASEGWKTKLYLGKTTTFDFDDSLVTADVLPLPATLGATLAPGSLASRAFAAVTDQPGGPAGLAEPLALVAGVDPTDSATEPELALLIAWLRYRQGDDAGAHAAMVASSARWPTPATRPAARRVLVRLSTIAGADPDRSLEAIYRLADGTDDDARAAAALELAAGYADAGEHSLARHVLLALSPPTSPALTAQLELQRATLAQSQDRPVREARALLAAWSAVRAATPAEAPLRERVIEQIFGRAATMAKLYRTCRDPDYGQAAQMLCAEYGRIDGRPSAEAYAQLALELAADLERYPARNSAAVAEPETPGGLRPPVIAGGLSPKMIREIVRLHHGAMSACYEGSLRLQPTLTGRVMLTFTVLASGEMVYAQTTSKDGDALGAVAACILDHVRAARFPRLDPALAGVVIVNYPIVLAPDPASLGRR